MDNMPNESADNTVEGDEVNGGQQDAAFSSLEAEGKRQRKKAFYEWLSSIGVKIILTATAAECEAERALLTLFNIVTDCLRTHTFRYPSYHDRFCKRRAEYLLRAALSGNKVIPDEAVPHLVEMAQISLSCMMRHLADCDLYSNAPRPAFVNLDGFICKYSELYEEYDFVEFKHSLTTDTASTLVRFYLALSCVESPDHHDQRRLANLSTLSAFDLAELLVGVNIFTCLTVVHDRFKLCSDLIVYAEDDPQERDCCAICLEDFVVNERLRRLYCSHKFHKECIDHPGIELSEIKTCPMCREDFYDFMVPASGVRAMAFCPLLKVERPRNELFPTHLSVWPILGFISSGAAELIGWGIHSNTK